MNGLQRMLFTYLKLQAEIRFSRVVDERSYRLQGMKSILNLTSDDEEALQRVFDQGKDEKDTMDAIVVLEEQTRNDKTSVHEVTK